jgi:hypothetical protein
MVDQESATYRPRRAYIEPDAEPAQPERPVQPERPAQPERNVMRPAQPERNGMRPAQPERNGTRPAWPPVAAEDHPKPLYRDDTGSNGWSRPTSRMTPMESDPPTDETMRPIAFAPRRPAPTDDETTTILPRSRPTKHRTQALDAIDDYDDERTPLGRRAKIALLIGAVAAVVVIGLVVGYAVLVGKQPQTQPDVSPSGGTGSQAPGQSATALLTDDLMLSPSQAKVLDRSRAWKVDETKHGASEDVSTPACFGGEPAEGQPPPQQEIVRVLSSTGKNAPHAVHAATAYSSNDEASAAYAVAAKTLGSCEVAGSWIESGHLVSRVGDQAAGVVVRVGRGRKTEAHSIVLNRTGRIMNVLDAVHPSDAIAIAAVAKALAQVNRKQCAAAGGECSSDPLVKDGPPPIGGDEPGFFTSGDLPPAGPKIYPWVATAVELPRDDFLGSQCEGVNWATIAAKSKSSRVYLIQESGKNFFGLNEVVLRMKDAKAAGKQVREIKSNLSSCKTRKLTASVTKPNKVTSMGAQNTKVSGWTAVVSQKSTQGTAKYRVGIVSAGPKVIYTFLNPRGGYDFTNHQWDTVAVRGGQRATQVD